MRANRRESMKIKMVYIDIDTGREVSEDWGHPVTAIDGMLSGKEPTVNGETKYRRILIRRTLQSIYPINAAGARDEQEGKHGETAEKEGA
jgi:hypothetical protein